MELRAKMKKIFSKVTQIKQLFARIIARFYKKDILRVAIVGSSNSVMRTGYANYLNIHLGKLTGRPTILNYYALGGVHSIYSLIQEDRHSIAANNDIIFFEFCLTDRYVIEKNYSSLELVGKTLEGFIRKARRSNPQCLIVILILHQLENIADDYCQLIELYESIAQRYELPVVNVTKSLRQTQNLEYVRTLYRTDDPAHYTRPNGVKVVAQTIADELLRMGGVIHNLKLGKPVYADNHIPPTYSDNFQHLKFFNRFENSNFFIKKTRALVYRNTIFKEKYFPVTQGNALKFLLKGQLVAVFVKADLDHGFIEIEFNNQRIVTSTYTNWLNSVKPRNAITLVSLPLIRFSESSDFMPVLIANCKEYPQDFELEYFKILPTQQDLRKWKLNIIGIAYIGELRPCKLDYFSANKHVRKMVLNETS
jgi:hypothetical protein